MRFVLLTTSDLGAGRSEQLARLIRTVAESRTDGLDVTHLVLLQRCTEGAALSSTFPDWTSLFTTPDQVSASAARNFLLLQVQEADWSDNRVVLAFPDDDAWYPPGLLRYVAGRFDNEPCLDVVVCRYSSTPAVPSSVIAAAGSVSDLSTFIRSASASTLFVRGRVAAQAGNFDEQLGLGTPVAGAEDLDFALRCRFLGQKSAAIPVALVGHPDKPRSRRARYYPGNLVVHWRYVFRHMYMPLMMLRMIASGFHMILNRELSPSEFLEAVRVAVSGTARLPTRRTVSSRPCTRPYRS